MINMLFSKAIKLLLVIPLLFIGQSLSAVDGKQHFFKLDARGKLAMTIPQDWNIEVKRGSGDGFSAIHMTGSDGQNFIFLLSPVQRLSSAKPGKSDLHELRRMVDSLSKQILPSAVEKSIFIREVRKPHAGYFFNVTDKAPEPDGYKYMQQGMVFIDNLLATFTVLTNTKNSPVDHRSLKVIQSAIFHPARDQSKSYKLKDVTIKKESLPVKCRFVEGEYPVSIQATIHYKMVDGKDYITTAPQKKTMQSFDCGGKKSTVYYYQYKSQAEVKASLRFIQALIWGEKGRSTMHPEMIVPVGNILVIISSHQPGDFEQLIP